MSPSLKNRSFIERLGFSLRGITYGARHESSIRTHLGATLGLVLLLVWLRPAPLWWAILLSNAGMVLGAEFLNTALEHALDLLHPEIHPTVKAAKDCAAGAVLLVTLVALASFAAFLVSLWR